MGHMKKSATTGHLLKNAGGHLVKTCAAAWVPNSCWAGVNATVSVGTMCDAVCFTTSAGADYMKWSWDLSGMDVDGVYYLPFVDEAIGAGELYCRYDRTFPNTSIILNEYSGTGCAGAPISTQTNTGLRVLVHIHKATGLIRYGIARPGPFTPSSAYIGRTLECTGNLAAYPVHTGVYAPGTVYNDTIRIGCNLGNIIDSGGSMIVEQA